jgi:hypothetical protein
MGANEEIKLLKKNPGRVGKLVLVEKNVMVMPDGKPCTRYSFEQENKDGTLRPHWLQILVRQEGGRSKFLDFNHFGW